MIGAIYCDHCGHGIGTHASHGRQIGPGVYFAPPPGTPELGPCTAAGCACADYYRDPERLEAEAIARLELARVTRHATECGVPWSPNRAETIALIREHLGRRSGRSWSVTGGRGTAYGWILIMPPPARRVCNHLAFDPEPGQSWYQDHGADCQDRRWYMGRNDAGYLGYLLGSDSPVHCQGESIPSGTDHYRVAIARAMFGETLGLTAERNWD